MGHAIDELGGRYLAAEDVGATPGDMDVLALETPWVTGVDPAVGGSGDPSPVTAVGVLAAMRAVSAALDGRASVEDRRVVVQGAGHVGANLVRLLAEAGASVVVADVNEERARAAAEPHDAEVVPPASVLETECDVLAPSALGGVLTAASIPRLRCRAICGAANNQLDDGPRRRRCSRRAASCTHPTSSPTRVGSSTSPRSSPATTTTARSPAPKGSRTRCSTCSERANADGVAPQAAAEAIAWERLEREGRGHWRPGDPAAWTNGEPLRALRPVAA